MRRIGLFGGSFNPIHKGHLHLIEGASECLSLDQVIVIPACASPFKQHQKADVLPSHRLAMCRLATEELPYCQVDSFELEQEGVSYTYHTAKHFRAQFPEAELILLVGSDMLLQFDRWYRWQEILQMVSLAVVSREIGDREKLAEKCDLLLQYGKIYLCNVSAHTISSTKIRENLQNQKDVSCYLPEKVVQYILNHRLYQL